VGQKKYNESCSVLQCVAVCCSVLLCVTVCCSELQCVAMCCSVLQEMCTAKVTLAMRVIKSDEAPTNKTRHRVQLV
jgi:hypothetical protein